VLRRGELLDARGAGNELRVEHAGWGGVR
jgi:hypothetical protein